MLFVKPIIDMVETVIASNYVIQKTQDRTIANLALVNSSGTGKSRIVRAFSGIPGYRIIDNISYDQLAGKICDEIKNDKTRLLAFPEFNKILARKEATRISTLGILNILIDEGITAIEMPHANMYFETPLKCGEILAVTTSIFNQYFLDWWRIGFLQRHLVESWSYTDEQITEICSYIEERKFSEEGVYAKSIDAVEVELPVRQARIMRPFAFKLSNKVTAYAESLYKAKRMSMPDSEKESYPFRYLKVLNLLQMGKALLRGKNVVTTKDTHVLVKDLYYMNLDRNPLPTTSESDEKLKNRRR